MSHDDLVAMLIVARGCAGPLNDADVLMDVCRTAVEEAGLRVVADGTHAFVPHGISIALLLAQSHLTLSTWPEHRLAVVDLAICGPPEAAESIRDRLAAALRPDDCDVRRHVIALTPTA